MKTMISVALLLTALVLPAGDLCAEESLPTRVSYLKADQAEGVAIFNGLTTAGRAWQEEKLSVHTADFMRFAQTRIEEMNRNLAVSRERMQIHQEPDGSFRAMFHQIDQETLSCEVSNSASHSIPYVAVLSYREQVYATSCATPDECLQGPFMLVGLIPNRHIFSYSNGTWN